MEVRQLTQADSEAFWKLRLRALRDHPELFGVSYEEILERGITGSTLGFARYQEGEEVTFGAFVDGLLVGIAGFKREEPVKLRHKGRVWGMYVLPEFRSKGSGRALLEAAIAHARSLEGLEQINLNVVITSKEARLLFVSLGFETYGLERRALKLHDHYFDQELMTLRIR